MKKLILISLLFSLQLFGLQLGETPPLVNLEGKDGGKTDGSAWNSTKLKDRVFVLFYVDPDERSTNEEFSQALQDKKFDKQKYGSVAIVNMAATWMPDFAIESKLKAKQEKYPNALYVKDKRKTLVKKWGLADDASNIVVFGKDGKVLYFKKGKLAKDEILKVLQLIEDNF